MTNNNDAIEPTEPFHPSLTRQLIQTYISSGGDPTNVSDASRNINVSITDEALIAAGEVLRLFVLEARYRAGIEAECEHEGGEIADNEDQSEKATTDIPIRADHITKIAADLLMDFS